MSQNIVAERYALALFEAAKEQNIVPKVEEELRMIKQAVTSNPGFITLLQSPNLSLHEKKTMLEGVFAGVTPLVINTLKLLVDRHRQDEILGVADGFIASANKENGIAEAVVYSVRPLTGTETETISATFAAKVGRRTLNIENVVDSNLLGGVKIRIGNRIFDGSLQGKLNRLERTLTT